MLYPRREAVSNFDVSSLSYLQSAAAPLGEGSIDQAIGRFAKAGAKVVIGQGGHF
jgi:hypothetical protein